MLNPNEIHNRLSDYRLWIGFMTTATVWGAIVSKLFELAVTHRSKIMEMLSERNLPRLFAPLTLLWPKPVRRRVWLPSFRDEQACYYSTLHEGGNAVVLNLLFSLKIIWLVVVTARISLVDRKLARLQRRLR